MQPRCRDVVKVQICSNTNDFKIMSNQIETHAVLKDFGFKCRCQGDQCRVGVTTDAVQAPSAAYPKLTV